ncbi:hypothetical protein SPRG_01089 [Saprolegnia parasitica CBS 223.65]|uniref:Glycoside hydrolase family 5 domain-containing protein n=1 Tax=Saprolegnia parasitica (strain CBS 223.65) TaxID=695850 RepID=A0A067D0I9_SAPPC|nr:hypothetical protein SPRG_01089 [Saprolegnia parasitica CBS 223.65]KDO35025.1 hypothetical protein SPRG_01089 [Saprolegnia parasitica CBS 223.65]|eukprot:XP_012194678.1 hypothetical protein SPRG_01089 [Saprolegnia parasitica CBS 223.65]
MIPDDEETKEADAPFTRKDHHEVGLHEVIAPAPTAQGCLKTRRGKAILAVSVLGIIGIIVGLVVASGGSDGKGASQSTSDKNIVAPASSSAPPWTSPPTADTTTLTPVMTSAPTPTPRPPAVVQLYTPTPTPPVASTPPPSPTLAPTPAPTPVLYGKINDGTPGTAGQVTNMASFPSLGCKLPNYLSENGGLFAQAANGTKVPVAIKGINWFGMETELHIPFGLWANPDNGTSLFEVVAFLSRHNFNSIRLPLTVDALVKNTPPNANVVNEYESPGLNLTSYVSAVQSIVRACGAVGISVLLDIHYLSVTEKGDAWFSDTTPETSTLEAMDVLTTNLCGDAYWNVLGVDLKNEPWQTTWGDDGPKDFRRGATLLAQRMLAVCPNWLAFVEGNAETHAIQINGTRFDYYDWWGGGLQAAGTYPISTLPSKLVYAPHYYNPSVYPQSFLVASAAPRTSGETVLRNYTEWDDAALRHIVAATVQDMFGYLRAQGHAIVFGEFGDLFALDAHPRKTSQRVVDMCMQIMMEPGYSGGYMWALNPESGYGFNPSDTAGYWTEGLLQPNWRDVNTVYLDALRALDRLPHLGRFPCFT